MVILLLLILGFGPLVAAGPLSQLCPSGIFYPNSSSYHTNLQLLATTLSTTASSTRTLLSKGFVGTGLDRIYGVASCRGDSVAPTCPSCITTAFHDAWWLCGSHEDTHVLYEDCIVHISSEDLIYDSTAVLNRLMIFTDIKEDNMDSAEYTDVSIDYNIKILLQETAKQAAYNSTTRYATTRMDVNSTFPLLYSLAQCNLDLTPNDCWDCLDNIRSAAKSFFYQQHGEWIAGVWCNFRYGTYQFYVGQAMRQIAWSDVVDPTKNMTAPMPAPGPVSVPRKKDENNPVVVPSEKYTSKQDNRLFFAQN